MTAPTKSEGESRFETFSKAISEARKKTVGNISPESRTGALKLVRLWASFLYLVAFFVWPYGTAFAVLATVALYGMKQSIAKAWGHGIGFIIGVTTPKKKLIQSQPAPQNE